MHAYPVLVGKSEGKRPLGNLAVDGRIILKLILQKFDIKAWDGFIWPEIGTSSGLL
jgi:hypothetical protein